MKRYVSRVTKWQAAIDAFMKDQEEAHMAPDHERLITSGELGGRLGVTDETVRTWVRAGRIHTRWIQYTDGGQLRFREGVVEKLKKEMEAKP